MAKREGRESAFESDTDGMSEEALAALRDALATSDLGAFRPAMARLLDRVGRITGAECTALYSMPESSAGETLFFRCNSPVAETAGAEWVDRVRNFSWSLGRLLKREVIDLPDVDALPPEAGAEREGLQRAGVRSFFAMPLFGRRRMLGCLHLLCMKEERDWDREKIERIEPLIGLMVESLERIRSEDVRQRGEKRLRALASYTKDVICELSLAGGLLYVSPNVRDMLGYSAAEVTGGSWSEILDADDLSAMAEIFREADETGESQSVVLRARHRDGSSRWLEAEGNVFVTTSSRRHIVVVLRDVTERRQKESELEDRLKVEQLVSQLSRKFIGNDAMEIEEGIRHGLRAAASVALADRCFLVSLPEQTELAPNRYEWSADSLPATAASESGGGFESLPWFRERLNEGKPVPVPRVVDLPMEASRERAQLCRAGVQSCLLIPIRWGDALIGILGFECLGESQEWDDQRLILLQLIAELFGGALHRSHHESAREAFQRALEHQLDQEKRIAELSRYFLEVDPEQIVAGVESKLAVVAEMSGAEHLSVVFSHSEQGGSFASYHWWHDDIPAERRLVPRARDTHVWAKSRLLAGERIHLARTSELPPEATSERADFEARGVRSVLAIPVLSGGAFIGMVGIESFSREADWSHETITLLGLAAEILVGALRRKAAADELRESQAQLVQSQKMEAVGTLAGGIAHDFNNQLAVMLGNTRFARQMVDEESEVAEVLGDVERAAQHCTQLTRSLLAFSRRMTVQRQPLQVAPLIGEVRDLVSPMLPTSIELELGIEGCDEWVEADPTQLQQVLINLIVNARDAMEDGGHLWIDARRRIVAPDEAQVLGTARDGAFVEIRVRDEGCGMPENVASRVFEPFFTTKEVGRGTGLGLATAYGIVRQLGGSIQIESAIGEGTTFHVLLPAADLEGVEVAALAADVACEMQGGTVLLVEDEPALRRLLSRMLDARGYRVIEAVNGEAALERARAMVADIDVLVTDFTMPVMSGGRLARELLVLRPELPILLMSGDGEGEVEELAQRIDNARFLQKPFGEDQFFRALEEVRRG